MTIRKIIEITVSPDGSTKVETKGYTSSDCREASRELERSLGTVESERLTGEFYQAVAVQQRQSQQNG